MKNNPCTDKDFLENIGEIVDEIPDGKDVTIVESIAITEVLVDEIRDQIDQYRTLHSTAAAGACQAVKEANEAAEGIKRETEKLKRMT